MIELFENARLGVANLRGYGRIAALHRRDEPLQLQLRSGERRSNLVHMAPRRLLPRGQMLEHLNAPPIAGDERRRVVDHSSDTADDVATRIADRRAAAASRHGLQRRAEAREPLLAAALLQKVQRGAGE